MKLHMFVQAAFPFKCFMTNVTLWNKIYFKQDFRNLRFALDFDLSFSKGESLGFFFSDRLSQTRCEHNPSLPTSISRFSPPAHKAGVKNRETNSSLACRTFARHSPGLAQSLFMRLQTLFEISLVKPCF